MGRDIDTPLNRLLCWQRGETPGPWSITLMPTNRCNLRCSVCWQRQYTVDHSRELPEERLERLVDEAVEAGVMQWNISGGGEPLCRGDSLLRLCGRIRERGMNGVLQTNATLLGEKHIDTLIDIGWARIVASLDGPNPEINDAIRSAGSFERATTALSCLSQRKRARNSALPDVTLHTIVTNTNIESLDAMADRAHEVGCSAIEVSSLMGDTEVCQTLRHGLDRRDHVAHCLQRAAQHAETLGIQHNLDVFQAEALASTGPSAPPPCKNAGALANAVCFEPWLGLSVNYDGRVQPCCLYWSEDAPSIADHTLHEAWIGPFMERTRNQLARGILMPPCRQCLSPMLARNEAFRERLHLAQARGWNKASAFLQKAAVSVRRYGWRRAIQRAREWIRIGREW